MPRLLAALALAWLCAAQAGEDVEGRVGGGADVLHDRGMAMGSVSIYPVSLLIWEKNFGVGVTWQLGQREGWNGGLGLIYVERKDEDVGTHLNLLARLSYCGKHLCASFAHISHGAALGIRDEAANSGLNFLYLEYRFR